MLRDGTDGEEGPFEDASLPLTSKAFARLYVVVAGVADTALVFTEF